MLDIFSKDRKFKSESHFLLRQIEYYQQFIDPAMKKKLNVKRICRYTPTCSQYTKTAIKRHGAVKGIGLGLHRLLRCNPFSKGGFDPVR
ncbi:MAG: membrane protein insertion efficiency factor YidD [Candidatus Aenigmarchaeota archaeon]|nr:membrane protein insertion efficiency factor YidD [Candidatus Aenigmarchaeota archaeon]